MSHQPINLTTVSRLEVIIDYTFHNKGLAWEALQTRGCGGFADGNKRLALLGDAILKMEVMKKWYPSDLSRAQGQQFVEQVGQNVILANVGRELHLDLLIVQNPGNRGSQISSGQIADTMEAILGAVYADGGEKSLEDVMKNMQLDLDMDDIL